MLINLKIDFNGFCSLFLNFKFQETVTTVHVRNLDALPYCKIFSSHLFSRVLSKSADLFDALPRSIMSSAMYTYTHESRGRKR
jgi:hypothetical protein